MTFSRLVRLLSIDSSRVLMLLMLLVVMNLPVWSTSCHLCPLCIVLCMTGSLSRLPSRALLCSSCANLLLILSGVRMVVDDRGMSFVRWSLRFRLAFFRSTSTSAAFLVCSGAINVERVMSNIVLSMSLLGLCILDLFGDFVRRSSVSVSRFPVLAGRRWRASLAVVFVLPPVVRMLFAMMPEIFMQCGEVAHVRRVQRKDVLGVFRGDVLDSRCHSRS